jgi:REP element-mobilizing transposase RayT
MLATAHEFGFAVVAYCVMPDHVHVLLTAERADADLTQFAKQAKQITGFHYRQATNQSLWQPGYHVRILRDEEATLAVARYILENPVRAGLTKALGEWPHAGSGVYTWRELLTAWNKRPGRPEGLHYKVINGRPEGLHYESSTARLNAWNTSDQRQA